MKYRAVLAGCGNMSDGWLKALATDPVLKDKVELVGTVDLDLDAAKAAAAKAGLEASAAGSDLVALLGDRKPDLLFDVVTPSARRSVVEAGFAAGCHVLSEKPMAVSLEDARAMIAAAERAGRRHAIIQNRRYNSGVRRVRATVESGILGELTAIHADFFIGAHFGGFRDQMRNVLLVDMAIHTFDAARYMAGEAPRNVFCLETNPPGSWYAHGAAANAIFQFSNDVTFTYRGSWAAEGAPTSWDSSWRIIGSQGSLLWDGEENISAQIVASDEGFLRPLRQIDIPPPRQGDSVDGHQGVIRDFVTCVESGARPETDSTDNIQSLAMVLAAVESARLGQSVSINV